MNRLLFLFTLLMVASCNFSKKENKQSKINITKIEVFQKEFQFGNATLNDTIVHIFKIKNITDTDLKITNISTSCGCTAVGKIDSIAKKNQFVEIKVQFIPKKQQIGKKVSNSVVVEMNTEPPFTVFRLKGNIVE